MNEIEIKVVGIISNFRRTGLIMPAPLEMNDRLNSVIDFRDRYQMAELIEERFKISLEREEIEAWSTVRTVIDSVKNQLSEPVETDEQRIKRLMPMYGTNLGHGHVWSRPDGSRARCGGPGLCTACARDKEWVEAARIGNSAFEPVAREVKDQDGHPVEALVPKQEPLPRFKQVVRAIEEMNCDDLIRLIPSEVEQGVWDHSVADLYLVTKLFIDGHGEDQVVHFFRNSWLMREKFNRPDYQRKTLDVAKRSAGLRAPTINRITRKDVDDFKNSNYAERNALDQYKHIATKSAIYPGQGTPLGLMYVALKMNGEAGEFAEHVGKAMRDDDFVQYNAFHGRHEGELTPERRELIIKEIGDVLWYLSAACNELGISLTHAATANLEKLYDRTQRDVLRGSGDER